MHDMLSQVYYNKPETTIKDYIRDLVLDTQKKFIEVNGLDERITYLPLTEDQVEELVDETTDIIAKRIVGAEY